MSGPFRKLDAYTGALTPEQAAGGIEAATENARGLLQDAALLLENKRWPRAASLSILAIEEAGKLPLLRSLLLAESENDLRQEWRAYRTYTQKNVMGAFLEYVDEAPSIEDFRPLLDGSADSPRVLEAVKQLGFYSDCLGNAHWSIPAEVIGEDLARGLYARAALLVPRGQAAMTSTAELRLWVKHMKPVWRMSMLAMKQALLNCYQEASDLGVLQGHRTVEDMVRFLL